MTRLTPGLQTFLENEGYCHLTEIEGRGICAVYKFMFTFAIVYGIDEHGYRGRWCYSGSIEPAVALRQWNGIGDPLGNWIKYKGEGGERSRVE